MDLITEILQVKWNLRSLAVMNQGFPLVEFYIAKIKRKHGYWKSKISVSFRLIQVARDRPIRTQLICQPMKKIVTKFCLRSLILDRKSAYYEKMIILNSFHPEFLTLKK